MKYSDIVYDEVQERLDLQTELLLNSGDSEEGTTAENVFFRVGTEYLYRAPKLAGFRLVQGLIEGSRPGYRYAYCWLENNTEVIDILRKKRMGKKFFYFRNKIEEDQLVRFITQKDYASHAWMGSLGAHLHRWLLNDVPVKIYPDGREQWPKRILTEK